MDLALYRLNFTQPDFVFLFLFLLHPRYLLLQLSYLFLRHFVVRALAFHPTLFLLLLVLGCYPLLHILDLRLLYDDLLVVLPDSPFVFY